MNQIVELWSGQYGKAWTDRNDVDPDSRVEAFRRLVGNLRIHTILEVGCNRGFNLIALSKIGNYELTGVDLQQYAVDKANMDMTEIPMQSCTLVTASCFDLPFLDSSFDLVMTSGLLMLYKMEDMLEAVKELIRVSKHYILVIEYPGVSTDRLIKDSNIWEIETLLRYKGIPLHWARDYADKFPGYSCIARGEVPEFSSLSYYWLFSKEGAFVELRTEADSEYIYPVADCPLCGTKEVPFGLLYMYDGTEPQTYCLNCHEVVSDLKPKGYASFVGLEEGGWSTEV